MYGLIQKAGIPIICHTYILYIYRDGRSLFTEANLIIPKRLLYHIAAKTMKKIEKAATKEKKQNSDSYSPWYYSHGRFTFRGFHFRIGVAFECVILRKFSKTHCILWMYTGGGYPLQTKKANFSMGFHAFIQILFGIEFPSELKQQEQQY